MKNLHRSSRYRTFRPLAFALITFVGASLISFAAEDDTPLEVSMHQMGKAFKELSKDLKTPVDTDKDKYLALAATLKTESQKAVALSPKLAETLPPDQKDAMVQAYHKDMAQFGVNVDSLIQALTDGKWDDAQKLVATLKQEMMDGHKAYRKKD